MYSLKRYVKWRRALALRAAGARSPKGLRHVLLASIGLALAAPVRATVLVPVDLGELSRDASAIVRGHVAAVDSRWSDDRRSIQTIVTLDVESSLKGPLGSTARFVLPGGALGRYRSIVVGAPEFVIGQHVVVFLGWRGPSYPYLLGFSQGVFRVVTARDGSGSVVIPPPIVAPVAEAASIVRGDIARRPLSLAVFEQRVRAVVGERQ